MEQLVARWAHNPKVTGSSPVPATQESLESETVQGFYFFYPFCPIQIGANSPLDSSLNIVPTIFKQNYTFSRREGSSANDK